MNNAPDIYFPNLGITFNNVPRYFLGSDPNFSLIYISGTPLNIYMYAVMIVTGIISAYFLAIWWVKKSGQKVNDYTDLLLLGVILAFVGLRLYYMIFNFDAFRGRNLIAAFFDLRGGGLAIYGGIIGAAVAAYIIGIRKKIKFTVLADTGAPSMLLGQIIGRWGNFFNREAFGGYTDGLFAMRLPLQDIRMHPTQLAERAPEVLATENISYHLGVQYIQVHPTFFYEAALNLPLMLALLIYRPYKRFDGEIVLLYFLGYGVIRFFLESLRTDQLLFFGTGLAASQLVALGFVLVSATLIILGHMKAKATKKP
jgi:phosphatidylglycerol:prolipoprotein diacylglycerol transferase